MRLAGVWRLALPSMNLLPGAGMRCRRLILKISGTVVQVHACDVRDERITLSERFDLTGLTPAQRAALGLTTFDAINFFTNAVDLKTRGIEAVADYRTRAWGGALGLNAAYSYAKNSIRGVATPPSDTRAWRTVSPSISKATAAETTA